MFRKVLIANRGAIACRISRTLKKMGIASVAVYSEADRHSLHVLMCDQAVLLGPAAAAVSYLSIPSLLRAALETGAEAIHPGYGFLSEDAGFAEACAQAGIIFIGPTPSQLRDFGLKHTAREIARQQRLPLLPGTNLLASLEEARLNAGEIGYPVMLKSTAGGGGIGMRLCTRPDELDDNFAAVERLGRASFGTSGVYLEKFVSNARHIEVQIFGDGLGEVLALGERDCSAQRRNQKVIEETPAPGLPASIRQQFFEAAISLGKAVNYQSAGTVEFLYDNSTQKFYFLEVNTRLQVEHGVTEEVTGVDIVEWMIRQAAGELPQLETLRVVPRGSSVQVRLYAEDPGKQFQPSSGKLMNVSWAQGCRIETWVEPGTEVTPFYDPMLAKIIVHAENRQAAVSKLQRVLGETEISGIETNLHYLRQVIADPAFVSGEITTSFLPGFHYKRCVIDVLDAGMQTTIQDYPGRLGFWNVGVPPSGPIDSFAFRAANRLVGNEESAPALEITLTGPSLQFSDDAVVSITGADFGTTLDGIPVRSWSAFAVQAGSVLRMKTVQGPGARAYLAIAGGIEAPSYMGSRSTFILGGFGGLSGRVLCIGDVLHLGDGAGQQISTMAPEAIPRYANEWSIGVLYGPHGAPDYFTERDIEMLFATIWTVHHNSDRTGIRLLGPKPEWARKDGGEAGLHPSNIHDNAYAIGTLDFTGDMPVILGPDGPSLGGFVCPVTIVEAERWKMGQLKPGDSVSFFHLTYAQAVELDANRNQSLATLTGKFPELPAQAVRESPILRRSGNLTCRADGDRYLLIEYGDNVLDVRLRVRAHALEHELRRASVPGILDITPGIRSLHVHYDGHLRRETLLEVINACEERIGDLRDFEVPSRVVHLPLSWDDPATQLAIQKYMQSVRPDAPWCPSNLEFIRRINGLSSIDQVHRIVYGASYQVLGLGDVYLGAPVATPIDPRHRLVTTKYNPARTWTPENAVGIGGAYLCVYGMEGPGGYQFIGRTLQMWNTFRTTKEFAPGTPWLLRFFDQIRFYPVSARELLEIREEFPYGQYPLTIESDTFRLRDYERFLEETAPSAAAFKSMQQQAFDAERERWAEAGQAEYIDPPDLAEGSHRGAALPEGCAVAVSPLTASVWNIGVAVGQQVVSGQKLVILEAMKIEIAVTSPVSGVVESLHCTTGMMVIAGQQLVVVREVPA